jgi:cyanophycinase
MNIIQCTIAAAVLISTAVQAQSSSTRVGPPRGTVIVVGGGAMGPEITGAFIKAAGGPDALIIDVPNAGGAASYGDDAAGARMWRRAGARNVHVLFTTDRKLADADSFVAVLAHAGGIWFEGGRQFHLVDAYAGTKAEQAFRDVLARGGVIGGSSAGATILGDFLVRGAPSNDNSIMDYPGYEKGFAYLRNVGIDQHVVARERLADLADSIMPRHPHLLGMSEDEGTAWVVRGDTATIIGRDKAFVYGGNDATDAGKPFLTLYPGDRYDLGARRVLHRAVNDSPVSAAFVDSLFRKYDDPAAGGATVLVAQNGEVFIDRSYGVPPQVKYMPTTTLPQFQLGAISDVFGGLCAQLSGQAAGAARTSSTPSTPLQGCIRGQLGTPIGLHRTVAATDGSVESDVDELYRLELGLEDSLAYHNANRAAGWNADSYHGLSRLTAYGSADGRRNAFVRIPAQKGVVIVLTNDPAADARGIADAITGRLERISSAMQSRSHAGFVARPLSYK